MSDTKKRKREEKKDKKKASPYRQIKGVKYDKAMLDVVDTALEDKNKLTIEDCKKLYLEVTDDNKYSDIEKATMKYIRENYKFQPSADQWIRRAIRLWAIQRSHERRGKKEE